MASEFVNAYLKKREEEKKANPSSSVSDRSQFAQEYLSKRYEGDVSGMAQRADANDIYYDFVTGKSYSASQRAAARAKEASYIKPRRLQSVFEQAQELQKAADALNPGEDPHRQRPTPDYGLIDNYNQSSNNLSLAARSRALAQKALAEYEKQYRTQLDSYGPYIDGSGKDVAGQYNARKKAVDDANQAYEDALALYQKDQWLSEKARRDVEELKEIDRYNAAKDKYDQANEQALSAWSSYYSMLYRAQDFDAQQQNPYTRDNEALMALAKYNLADPDTLKNPLKVPLQAVDKAVNPGSAEQQIIDEVLSDDELALLTYLRNTQGEKAVQEYLQRSEAYGRLQAQHNETLMKFAQKHPVSSSIMSTLYNTIGEVTAPVGMLVDKLSGKELSDEAAYFALQRDRDLLRAGVMQDMGPVGQFVYQTLMSAVLDSGVNGLIGAATGGSTWVGAGLTGASGFSDMVRQIKKRGGDDTQALVLGLIEGAAEVVTEKMGFDRVADLLTSKTPFKSTLKSVLANMMSEFGEESITTVINQTADYLYGEISGRETEFTKRIEGYLAEGKTEGEALANALLDMGGETLMDGLGGALGGVVRGGGAAAINKGLSAAIAKYADYKSKGQTQTASQTAQETTQAQQNAQVTENQPIAENRAETVQEAETRARIERLAQETADAEMGEQAARQDMRQTEQQRVRQTTENASAESVHNAAAVYGKDAASFESHYEGGALQNYRRAFDAVYQAGKVNLSLEQVNQAGGEIVSGLSEQAKAEIWQAGRNAAASVVVPGVSKQYVGKMNHNQRAQIRILDAIGKKYGIQIDVVNSLDYGRTAGNAALVGRNHIVVASDAMNSAYVQAGVHELVHNLRRESSAYYDAFSSVVLDTLKKDGSFDLQAAVSERIRQYAEQGQHLSEEDALEEIVAEAAPAALTNREAMRAFVKENRSLAEKVRDFFVRFADELRKIVAKYGAGNSRAEVDAMLRADSQDLVNIAESLDMALSAVQEDAQEQSVQVQSEGSAGGESEAEYSRKWPSFGLSEQEWAMFYRKIGEMKAGKSAQLHVSPEGYYIFDIENKLVYTDGGWMNPKVVRVVAFNLTDGTELDAAKQFFIDGEDGRVKYERIRDILADIFEKEVVSIHAGEVLGETQRQDGEGEGQGRTGAGEGNRGNLSAEEGSKFSLKDSENFKKWFGDSKVVDKNGDPLVVYHATDSEFNAFDRSKLGDFTSGNTDWRPAVRSAQIGFWFSDHDLAATVFTDPEKTKAVYLSIQKPYRTKLESLWNALEHTRPETYVKRLQERGYDGLRVQDSEFGGVSYVAFEPTQIKSATNNSGAFDPANPDIRFSLKYPVEETKDLIAVHNLTEKNLLDSLKLGGLPSPSLAVVRVESGHSMYGPISLVFDKSSIDPQTDTRNHVYGSDAYTPTNPGVEYPVNYDQMLSVEKRLNQLAQQVAGGIFQNSSVIRAAGIEDTSRENTEQLAERLANKEVVRAAYLADRNETLEPVIKAKEFSRFGNDTLKAFIKQVGEQKLVELNEAIELGKKGDDYATAENQVRQLIRAWFEKEHKTMLDRKPELREKRVDNYMRNNVSVFTVEDFIRNALEFYRDGEQSTDEIDRMATSDALMEKTDEKDVTQWLLQQFDGMLGAPGIYNGKERFTPSGKRRSFDQLHYAYTLENIVRAMNETQRQRGEGIFGISATALLSTATPEYGSIDAIKSDSARLRLAGDEEYSQLLKNMDEDIDSVIQQVRRQNKPHSDNSFEEGEIIGSVIMSAAVGKHTTTAIIKAFGKEGYVIDNETAKQILALYHAAARFPTGYFEAKPQRAVRFDEVKAAIIPESTSESLKNELKERVGQVIEYADGDEQARLEALNSLENVKFSLKDTSEVDDQAKALMDGVDVEYNAEVVQAYARSALRAADKDAAKINQQVRQAAGKILKDTASKYDRKTLESNMRAIVEAYARDGGEGVGQAAAEMAKAIIEKNTHLDTTLRDQYSALRRDLRENGVSLTENQKAEAASIYGSYNEFRRALMGTVKLTDKSMTLEARWDELSTMYPEIFRADTVEGDQINALMAFKQMMQPVYTNDFGMDMDTAAVDLGLRIQGDALSIAGAKEASKQFYGSAQKIENRVKKAYDAELKAQKKVKVAQFQEIAERLAEAKKLGDTQGYDSAMADYRKLIRKETGVKMPGGDGMSPSAKMRFSQLAEDMQAAREANDTAAYQRAFADYRALLKKERIASTVVAPAVQDALNLARARFKANQEAKEGTVKKQKATQRVIKQAKALVDMLGNKKKGVRVPRMMQDSLLTLLEGLDINGRGAANKGEVTKQAAAMREQLIALRQTYQAIWNDQAKGEAPAVLDGLMMVINEEQRAQLDDALSILEQGGHFTLRSMTTEQLKALGDALMTVKQTISTIGVLWRKGRYQNVAELADASIQEMGKRPDARLNAVAGLNAGRDFLALDMLEPVSYGERLGQAGSEIIQGLYEGEREKFGRLREAQTAAAAMMKDADVTSYDIGRWRSHVNTVRMGGHDVKLTDTQAMDIYLTAMRPQGKQHMLGNGIRLKTSKQTGAQVFTVRMTEADIAKVSDLLSDQQKRMAHKLQEYLAGDVAKWGNDVTQQLYLYDYFTEKTYWPLTSDPNVLKSKEPTTDFRLDALTNPGFLKPLNAGANNAVIIMDAFDVFNRHVAEMASYSGLAMPMIDAVNYLNYQQHDDDGLNTGSVKESMERLLGTGGQKYMTRLLQDLNHARHGDDLLALSKLGALYKKAAVTGKIRVVLQQPTAIARAAQEISPVYLAQGLKLGNKADIAEMEQHSALAWWKNNGSGMDIGVGRSADQVLWGNTSKAQTAMDKIETSGGLIDANRADAVTWAAMWRAVKRETQRIHPELQVGSDAYFRTVAERFDGIMDRTQVVDSVMHRSQIMRSQNGMVKELTAFKAEPIKSYNMLARAAMELGRNPKSRAAQAAVTRSVLVFAANAALTALAEALFDVFKHRDDDDRLMEYLLDARKGFLKEYTDEFLGSWLDNMNVIDLIPFATQAKDVLLNNDAPEMMSFEGLVSLRKAALTFNDHFVGENKQKTTTYGAIAPVLKAASQITGLPIAGIMANTEMLAKIADPQWLNYKAVSGKFADNYEALYAAILEGDKRAITRIRGRLAADTQGKSAKSPAQIDQGVANVLAEKDERIAQAYQLRKEGKSAQLVALKKQIMADGFTDAMVSAAINRYESQAKAQENTTQEKDMDAQLTAKLFNYENLYAAIRTGSIEDVGIIAEYLQANSTAKDPAAAIRSQVSGEFKQEYLDAVMNGGSAESLKKKLLSLGLTEDDLNGWLKDARYAEMKESVGEGDIADAKQTAMELIDSGVDVSNVVKSLNSKYRPLYIELVNSGRTAEAEKLQKDLESLGLIKKKTGQNYYRKDYMDKWVTDYNNKNK